MGESKPDTLHQIRINADIKYAIFTVDCEQFFFAKLLHARGVSVSF